MDEEDTSSPLEHDRLKLVPYQRAWANGSVKVYGLVDPRNWKIFYIGVTKRSLDNRLSEHIADAFSGKIRGSEAKDEYILTLALDDISPMIVELDCCSSAEREVYEMKYIHYYRRQGYSLTNKAAGGRGQRGTTHTEETKQKQREAMLRRRAANPELFLGLKKRKIKRVQSKSATAAASSSHSEEA